jgi:hypothetical protein
MGAHPWFYLVPYQRNVKKAMLELREREFQAGRYNPVVAFPHMTEGAPGAQHDSIEDAREAADADGTRSIVDIDDVADDPADPEEDPRFGVVSPVDPEVLQELYDTTEPTRQMLADMAFFEELERGTGVYVIVYDKGKPSEICFAGYSYD